MDTTETAKLTRRDGHFGPNSVIEITGPIEFLEKLAAANSFAYIEDGTLICDGISKKNQRMLVATVGHYNLPQHQNRPAQQNRVVVLENSVQIGNQLGGGTVTGLGRSWRIHDIDLMAASGIHPSLEGSFVQYAYLG